MAEPEGSFAVVADEVKKLVRQTGEATKNIEKPVVETRSDIVGVVEATDMTTRSVSNVSGNMTTISAAVEQQSQTTSRLSETARQLRAKN